MSELNIVDARVFTPAGLKEACVSVDKGKIKKVCKKSSLPKAESTLKARGRILLPAAVDMHVHVRDPGEAAKESWRTASYAAAAGGVATILDMPNNKKPTVDKKTITEKKKIAAKKSIVNFGVYCGVTEGNASKLPSLAPLACGFKLYMGETTGSLEFEGGLGAVFESAAEAGKPLVVHAEDGGIIQKLKAKNKSRTDVFAHADSHPPEAEEKAVRDVIDLTKKFKSKTHVTHVSSKEGIKLLGEAKSQGVELTCDVTPHHLLLDRGNVTEKGSWLKVTPPLREKGDRSALWTALTSGVVDCVATDHAPHLAEDKEKSIWKAASGLPGLDTMMPLLLNEVNEKRLTLARLVELTSTAPARIFNLKKGVIAEGFDADLTLVDLKLKKKVRDDELYTKCGWSPFNGTELKGWPAVTVVAGNTVFYDGVVIDEAKGSDVCD